VTTDVAAARQTDRVLAAAPDGADVAVRAPGRANLMGEHTDYNDGFVLPVALDLETVVVGRRIPGLVRLRSLDLPGTAEVDLATGAGTPTGWGRYVAAVARVLLEAGLPVAGLEGVLSSTVPLGAGLSSSAALEVAVATALLLEPVGPLQLARLCQRAENEGVGVRTGLMDQLSSVCGVAGSALFVDCRSGAVEPIGVPPGIRVLLVDSAVPRSLEGSRYDERRRQCEQAAADLGVPALRDADPDALDAARPRMDPVVWRRARHVVTEDARVLAAVQALGRGDTTQLGRLFADSHRSMSLDFETSTPEIDALVRIAVATPGVIASRLTGGGFGGCTVSLVAAELATEAADAVTTEYRERTGLHARSWTCAPAAGAGPLPSY